VTVELAREVAARIGALDGVVAVTLGGSLARGRADPRSDVDLGLHYDPAKPFSVEGLRTLATELDDGHAPELVGVGEWGPWINGGAWTRIRDTRVQVLFALNERWFLNEKGAVGEVAGFPRTPPGFAAGVDATLSGLGPEPAKLEAALQAMAALTATVRQTATSLDCR
jgi:hypothetical protein